MSDTINVPRELLERIIIKMSIVWQRTDETEELRTLLQAPAQPAPVQGWQMVPDGLTMEQKLQALASRFYGGVEWNPKAGDHYTTSRADLELYRVAKIEDGVVYTEYCTRPGVLSEWPEHEFTTAGFGPKRVHVPEWILAAAPQPPVQVQEAVKHDTKGSRKALGAMNAKLKAKIGRLERELATVKQSLTVEPMAYSDDVAKDAWIPVGERLPDGIVLAYYENSYNKSRIIRAKYVKKFTQESENIDDFDAQYDEETDTYYDAEGWYEMIDNWSDYSSVTITAGAVTHWMPLPAAPGAAPSAPKADDPVKVQLLEALTLAANRIDRLRLEVSQLNFANEVADWTDEARAAIAAARKGEGE